MNERIESILSQVIPTPNCCNQRRIELKKKAFTEWIISHANLSDKEIIERLKKVV